ncbi:hypothetical protein [Streptomyces sp. NPDC002602]|uniref:hypothetical protein n=1 Tax=Streptomyces sp. NPDC002602 TaxID=3364654 RepID=UPI003691F7DB
MPTEQLLVRSIVAPTHPGNQVRVGWRQFAVVDSRTEVPATRLALRGYLPGGQAARLDLAAGATE